MRPVMHSISCTDLEWEQIRERAQRAGLSISRYLVERGLAGKKEPPPRLVLGEEEQRALHDRIARIEERTLAGAKPGSAWMLELATQVGVLVDDALIDCAWRGHDMHALLADWLGDDRASKTLDQFLRRMEGRGVLPDSASR